MAHSLANITGSRKSTPATWGPIRMEFVASAAAISAARQQVGCRSGRPCGSFITEIFGLADGIGPLLGRACLDGLGPETKFAGVCGHLNSPSVRSGGGVGADATDPVAHLRIDVENIAINQAPSRR